MSFFHLAWNFLKISAWWHSRELKKIPVLLAVVISDWIWSGQVGSWCSYNVSLIVIKTMIWSELYFFLILQSNYKKIQSPNMNIAILGSFCVQNKSLSKSVGKWLSYISKAKLKRKCYQLQTDQDRQQAKRIKTALTLLIYRSSCAGHT